MKYLLKLGKMSMANNLEIGQNFAPWLMYSGQGISNVCYFFNFISNFLFSAKKSKLNQPKDGRKISQ